MDGINVPKSTTERLAEQQLKFWTALNEGRVYFGTDFSRDSTTGATIQLEGIYIVVTPDPEGK